MQDVKRCFCLCAFQLALLLVHCDCFGTAAAVAGGLLGGGLQVRCACWRVVQGQGFPHRGHREQSQKHRVRFTLTAPPNRCTKGLPCWPSCCVAVWSMLRHSARGSDGVACSIPMTKGNKCSRMGAKNLRKEKLGGKKRTFKNIGKLMGVALAGWGGGSRGAA